MQQRRQGSASVPSESPTHLRQGGARDVHTQLPSELPTNTPSALTNTPSDLLKLPRTMRNESGATGSPTRTPMGLPLLWQSATPRFVPRYDPSEYPTFPERKTAGPIGNWKRLPIAHIKLGADGPAEWWPQQEAPDYLRHSLLTETEANDVGFNRAAIQTESMRTWMYRLSNQQRRIAIISCAVAFEQFMQTQMPNAEWWLEGGSLIGAIRKPHKFVPWDNDADVTMMEDSWAKVSALLMREDHTDPQPNAEGAPCGCLLVDTASFGSQRAGYGMMNQIPGRVINECTGNYVDIFNARLVGMDTIILSQQPDWTDEGTVKSSWHRAVVLPPKPCKLDGYPFKCPAQPWRYVDAYGYSPPATEADHVWDAHRKVYEPKLVL
jgi:hypothetical protein